MSAGAALRSLFYILQPGMDINSRVDGARGRPYVDPTPAAWILFHFTSQLSGLTHKLITKESQQMHWANNERTPKERGVKSVHGFQMTWWLSSCNNRTLQPEGAVEHNKGLALCSHVFCNDNRLSGVDLTNEVIDHKRRRHALFHGINFSHLGSKHL